VAVEEILIYSVLYGLGEEYDAYKLIVQDKIDNNVPITAENLIDNLTNSSEVMTHAAQREARCDRINNKHLHGKSICPYCKLKGHKEDKCYFKYPDKAPEWWRNKVQNLNNENEHVEHAKMSLSDKVQNASAHKVSLKNTLANMKSTGEPITFAQVKEAVNKSNAL